MFSSSDGRGGWSEIGNLTASNQISYAFFGISVSSHGTWIAVGADMSNAGGVSRSGINYKDNLDE